MLRRWLAFAALAVALTADLPAEGEQDDTIAGPVPSARIEIHKAKRELLLFSGSDLLRRYRIGLGPTPIGHKTREGDGATPEGEYSVIVKNPQSRYYLSLGLNYPNALDARAGLEAGLISEAEFNEIDAAQKHGRRPPWNTKLGGEIYIHGNGSSSDWTLGCIALDDADMKELFHAASVGIPVIIRP